MWSICDVLIVSTSPLRPHFLPAGVIQAELKAHIDDHFCLKSPERSIAISKKKTVAPSSTLIFPNISKVSHKSDPHVTLFVKKPRLYKIAG